MIGKLIGGFTAMIISVSLVPTIAKQVNLMTSNQTIINGTNTFFATNMTGIPAGSVGATVISIIPLAFALGAIGVGLAIVYNTLRNEVGMFGGGDDDEDNTNYNSTGLVTANMHEKNTEAKEDKKDADDENRKVYKDTKPKHIEHDFGDREYKTDKADKTKFDDTTTKEKGKFEI